MITVLNINRTDSKMLCLFQRDRDQALQSVKVVPQLASGKMNRRGITTFSRHDANKIRCGDPWLLSGGYQGE